jgi:hypothetical protein
MGRSLRYGVFFCWEQNNCEVSDHYLKLFLFCIRIKDHFCSRTTDLIFILLALEPVQDASNFANHWIWIGGIATLAVAGCLRAGISFVIDQTLTRVFLI